MESGERWLPRVAVTRQRTYLDDGGTVGSFGSTDAAGSVAPMRKASVVTGSVSGNIDVRDTHI